MLPRSSLSAVILLGLFLGAGCIDQSRLDRAVAQRQLETVYSGMKQHSELPFGVVRVAAGRQFPEVGSDWSSLASAGLLTVRQTTSDWPGFDQYVLEFTPAALPFATMRGEFMANLLVATSDNVEILGITAPSSTERGVTCIVEYRLRFAPTRIGEVLPNTVQRTRDGKAVFVKYDDGWRLIQN